MKSLVFILFLFGSPWAKPSYMCGQKTKIKRPYGTIEQRVRCDFREDNRVSILEYKGDLQHGYQMTYDTLWRKLDSSFYIDGNKNGISLFWDTAGNVIGSANYRDGRYVGKHEFYFAPGKPSLIKHYNDSGKEEGPWTQWWENGNKKTEFEARNGHIVAASEYYQNGKPRARYRSKYQPDNLSALHIKRIEGEAWGPNGMSTGTIRNGNGKWIIFPDGSKPNAKDAFHYEYKDSLLVKTEKLTPAEMAKWMP